MIKVCPLCGSHFEVSEHDARCPRDGQPLRSIGAGDSQVTEERLPLWGNRDAKTDPPTVKIPTLSIEKIESGVELTPSGVEDMQTPVRDEKVTEPLRAVKSARQRKKPQASDLEFDEQTAEEYPSFGVKPDILDSIDDTDDGGPATTPDWGTQRKLRPALDEAEVLASTTDYNPKSVIPPEALDGGTIDDTDGGTIDDTDGGTLDDTDGGPKVDEVEGIEEDAETIDIRRAKLIIEAPPPTVEVDTNAKAKPEKELRLSVVAKDKRQFGRYVLHCRFASGGMADLYLASIAGPAGFEKLVAIKRIHENLTAQPGFLEMFLDEARLAARIAHPNVVDVIELGRVDDAYFIAMEYVPGQSLRSLLRRSRLPYALAAQIVSGAAAGLHAAHELCDNRGELLHVVHRDVSPGNVLISYEGAIKVLDFGVARARGNLHTTAVGMVKGKFAYMAPEQANTQPVDRRTDIFSLGIVLYEATTRRRLFKADTEQATLIKVLHEPILPPSALTEDYPMELERIVLKALEREPDRRFQTAQQMHDALESYIHELPQRPMPGAISSLMKRTFASQITEQDNLIRRCQNTSQEDAPIAEENWDLLDNPSGSSVLDGTVSAAKVAQRKQRLIRFSLVIVLLAIAVLITLAIIHIGSPPPIVPPRPTPPPIDNNSAPQQQVVQIKISATPKKATILVDGKNQPNPCELMRPRSEDKLSVVISAPGYVTQNLEVSLSRADHQLSIALDRKKRPPPRRVRPDAGRQPKPPKPRIKPPRPPRPPPAKKPERVKKLFSNPYEQ